MTTYLVTHSHKYGITNYMFESEQPNCDVQLWSSEHEYDDITKSIVTQLGIEYDHGQWGESLEIFEFDLANEIKTIIL